MKRGFLYGKNVIIFTQTHIGYLYDKLPKKILRATNAFSSIDSWDNKFSFRDLSNFKFLKSSLFFPGEETPTTKSLILYRNKTINLSTLNPKQIH